MNFKTINMTKFSYFLPVLALFCPLLREFLPIVTEVSAGSILEKLATLAIRGNVRPLKS